MGVASHWMSYELPGNKCENIKHEDFMFSGSLFWETRLVYRVRPSVFLRWSDPSNALRLIPTSCLHERLVGMERSSMASLELPRPPPERVGRQSVDSVISILRNLEQQCDDRSSVHKINAHRHPNPVQILSELNLPSTSRSDGKRTYSLYSTESDSTVAETKKAMDKVSNLISLLLGEEVALKDDFDETLVANQVLDRLRRKAATRLTHNDKENAEPASQQQHQQTSKTHQRKGSAKDGVNKKGFPKAIKRKTISVKNVKVKPIIASAIKQHRNAVESQSPQQQQLNGGYTSQPKKFMRPCQQTEEKTSPSPVKDRSAAKPPVACWNVETPAPSLCDENESNTIPLPSLQTRPLSRQAPLSQFVDGASGARPIFGVEAEVPVRDSDPVSVTRPLHSQCKLLLPPHLPPQSAASHPQSDFVPPLPPPPSSRKAVQREINVAVSSEEPCYEEDSLKTFHSQRRALRFLVNELRGSLTANYGPLESHCCRTLEAVDKIVTLMQKSKYVLKKSNRVGDEDADAEDDLSTASFASIDVDLALQPLRHENAQLRTRMRDLAQECQRLRQESQLLSRIFDEMEEMKQLKDGVTTQIKAIAIKEKMMAASSEIASLKAEVDRLQSSHDSLSRERQDLLRLLGSKDGDTDKARLEALEEASRLRKDLERYEGDIARSNASMKEKEERCRILGVYVTEKEKEIERLKRLVDSLQSSMSSLVGELQRAGPSDWPPVTPPVPASLMLSQHVVGPGGDGPGFGDLPKAFFPTTPPSVPTPFSGASSSSASATSAYIKPIDDRIQSKAENSPLTIPKTVSDSLREFLQAGPDEAEDNTLTRTVTPPDSPAETSVVQPQQQQQKQQHSKIDESSASRFSVSAYLKRYGLAVEPEVRNPSEDVFANKSSSTSSTAHPSNSSSRSKRGSGTFAQSTPASTPKKRIPSRGPDVGSGGCGFEKEHSGNFLPLSIHDDSTLTGISEISSISAISGMKDEDFDVTDGGASLSSVSSLVSKDEMEFKAGLEELDASIQRLRISLKKGGGGKNL